MARLVPPDRGWTKTPNRYLEESARAGASLPARHRSVLEVLVREILGWHCDAVAISQRTIARRLGVSDRTVREAIGDLERWRVIRRRCAGRGRVAVFELLDPRDWRISRTASAIRRAERRRLAAGDQPWLPFAEVAEILDLPTQIGDRRGDTRGGIPLRSAVAHLVRRKKSKGDATRAVRDKVLPGDRMPNDVPQPPTPLELRQIRRGRAARARIRRLDPSRAFDAALVEWVAKYLTEAEVDEEIRLRDLEMAAEQRARRVRLQAEAMRHEGRR